MMDHGLSLEEAFHRPRIDMSGEGRVIADRALPAEVIEELNRFLPTTTRGARSFRMPSQCPPACCARAR